MASSTSDLLGFDNFNEYEESPTISVNSPKKVSNNEEPAKSTKTSIFQIEYYQQFFNIDTVEVVNRIATSMIYKRAHSNYLRNNLGVNPDLYGPLWITITLIFTIAISGNLANFLHHDHNSAYHWKYNFHLVSYAATCIIFYVCLLPAVIWGVLKWSVDTSDDSNPDLEGSPYIPSLLSLVCLYGYSLAVYVPVSILWTIQISFLQWLLVMTGAFLSGSVLINSLMPSLNLSKFSLFLMIGIAASHLFLAAVFMLYFFHFPDTASSAAISNPSLSDPVVNTTG